MICVCSSYDGDKVMAAAQRLLDNAGAISGLVDLTGVPPDSELCDMPIRQ